MKKQTLTALLLTSALCAAATLSGCTAAAAGPAPDGQATPGPDTAATAAQAGESDAEPSPEEQAQAEQTRRADTAQQYSLYAPYGMTYDTQKDRFFYDGQIVRYFKDTVSPEATNGFFYADGTVDVVPVRDADGTLTGLKAAPQADFDARTKQQAELEAELQRAGATAESGSFEQGDPNYREDSLDAYADFGVSYDSMTRHWTYRGEEIYILYDAGHTTFCDKSAPDGVCLRVARGADGGIESLTPADRAELEPFVE